MSLLKKISFLILSPFFMLQVDAQLEILSAEDQKSQTQINVAGTGINLFCEDFANGYDGNSGFGSWTVEDNDGGNIWYVGGSGGPSGPLAGVADPIDSPSMENGYAIFDPDLYNDPDSPFMVFGSITSPPIDMSGMNSVVVDFYQSYIYCCSDESPIKMEVSLNGGTEWVVFEAHGQPIEFSNEFSPNNLFTSVDISCLAAGQSNVKIRFSFNRVLNPSQTHYFWMIDDVCIHENLVQNDVAVSRVAIGDLSDSWELYSYPIPAWGPSEITVLVENKGFLDQEGVVLETKILDDDGSEVYSNEESIDLPALTNSLDCPGLFTDSVFANFNVPILGQGEYTFRARLILESDESLDDNLAEVNFEITEELIAHKPIFQNDYEFRPESIDGTSFNSFGIRSKFKVSYDNVLCSVLVEFGPNTDPGSEIEVRVYAFVSGNWLEIESVDYTIQESDIPLGTEELVTQISSSSFPIEVFEGVPYAIGITSESSELECTIRALKDFDLDESTEFLEEGAWFDHQKITPAIYALSYCFTSVDEFSDSNELIVYPNPVQDFFQMNGINELGEFNVEIYSATGQLVMLRSIKQGNLEFKIDISMLPDGIYHGRIQTEVDSYSFSLVKMQ